MTRFCTRNIPTLFGVRFLSFLVNKIDKYFSRILATFLGPNTTGTGLEQAKLKTGPGWLRFPPQTYLQCLGCIFYRFLFWSNFDDYFGHGHHWSRPGAGKLEIRARINRFCTRNIPTLFEVQLISFLVRTAEKYFGRILTTFLGP